MWLRERSTLGPGSSRTMARPMEAILMPAPDAQSWHGRSVVVSHVTACTQGWHAIGGDGGGGLGKGRNLSRRVSHGGSEGERHTVEIVRIISLYQARNASPEAHARSSTAA